MTIIYFFYGLSFGALGLAAYLQLRRGGEFPLRKLLPWLVAFGASAAASGWVEMFLEMESNPDLVRVLEISLMILQPLSGLLLLIFGWGMFARLLPLPRWVIFVPGILIVPFAYVITYALSTFITPSPIEIPLDIWSRYLLYLPGSILAGIGFLRQWRVQRTLGYIDVAKLMLGAGVAFLIEAFVMGLVVPAAPYGPASYYNYDRVAYDAFTSESTQTDIRYGLTAWLDYQRVLEVTGLPIQFWRMLSALAVMGFVVRGLDVFEAVQRRHVQMLQEERDRALQEAFNAQISALRTAENWSDALVRIGSRIAELEDVDKTLLYIVESSRGLLNADFMGLALIQDEPFQLALRYYALPDRSERIEGQMVVNNPLVKDVLGRSKGFLSQNHPRPLRFQDASFFTQQPARQLAAVPLNLDNAPIGALWATRSEEFAFTDSDLIWLECLADQVIIALKHGLMTSQLQSLSVTEERSRIAREMHDGLAQVLGYMNLQVQTLEAYLEQGKLDKLHLKLDQMREAVQSAHADVREKILSLRTTLANEKGVVQAMQEYLEEFGIQTKVATQFENLAGDELNLSSLAEVQLVCILQEALTNVRKHAGAETVQVSLSQRRLPDGDWIEMTIQDDGAGFTQVDQKRSFGLQIMRERAHNIGGALEVLSFPGQGTRVECSIPCLHRQPMPAAALEETFEP